MAKGSSFEREMAKKLSLWWSSGERDDVFWRSQSSGARHTIRRKAGKDTHGQVGDLTATHPSGESLISNVIIELKRGYNRSVIHDFLDGEPGKSHEIRQWVEKVDEQSKAKHGGRWMIIHRRDRREPLVYISEETYDWIDGRAEEYDGGFELSFISGTHRVHVRALARILKMSPERFKS